MNNYEVETYEGPFGKELRDNRFQELRNAKTPGVVKFSSARATGQFRLVRYAGSVGRPQKRFTGESTWSVAYPRS